MAGVNTDTFVSDVAKGGKPYIAAKYHDYFTSCLPSPQKGPDVLIPSATAGEYPVVPRSNLVPDSLLDGTFYQAKVFNAGSNAADTKSGLGFLVSADGLTGTQTTGLISSGTSGTSSKPVISNLWAIASGGLGATINQLRLAFQVQKLYERDARGGSRYIEILKSHFGVTSPDARLQRRISRR